MGMLGVTYTQYAPYALLNWIDPLVSLLLAITGLTMVRLTDGESEPH